MRLASRSLNGLASIRALDSEIEVKSEELRGFRFKQQYLRERG